MIRATRTLFGAGLTMTLLGGCLATENPDFNQQAADAVRFIRQLDSLPVTADMPTTGSAEYTGLAAFNYDSLPTSSDTGRDLFADMTLTADFGTNSVTGEITRFNSPTGSVSGDVDVTDGAIVSNLMQANAGGTITEDGVSTELTLDLLGQFRDEDAGVLTGEITGTYETSDGESGDMFGSFGVEQD